MTRVGRVSDDEVGSPEAATSVDVFKGCFVDDPLEHLSFCCSTAGKPQRDAVAQNCKKTVSHLSCLSWGTSANAASVVAFSPVQWCWMSRIGPPRCEPRNLTLPPHSPHWWQQAACLLCSSWSRPPALWFWRCWRWGCCWCTMITAFAPPPCMQSHLLLYHPQTWWRHCSGAWGCSHGCRG